MEYITTKMEATALMTQKPNGKMDSWAFSEKYHWYRYRQLSKSCPVMPNNVSA
jgi:hypothetical protein